MLKPNFFIVGSTKAGTTSLHNYLADHPKIFMSSVKEPHYFCYKDIWRNFTGPGDIEICQKMVVNDLPSYLELFDTDKDAEIYGESTASYLHIKGTAEKLFEFNPNAKILISLRHPVDRLISAYNHLIRDSREPETLLSALQNEKERLASGWMPFWGYESQSYYFESVYEYIELFGKDNVKIIVYEKDFKDIEKLLNDIQLFLGVDNKTLNHGYVENSSGKPRFQFLHNSIRNPPSYIKSIYSIIPKSTRKKLKSKLNNLNKKTIEPLNIAEKNKLEKLFVEDVHKLESLVPGIKDIWGIK